MTATEARFLRDLAPFVWRFHWRWVDGQLRTAHHAQELCPVTALACARLGLLYGVHEWGSAALRLGYVPTTLRGIVGTADNDGPDGELEAALCTLLEVPSRAAASSAGGVPG